MTDYYQSPYEENPYPDEGAPTRDPISNLSRMVRGAADTGLSVASDIGTMAIGGIAGLGAAALGYDPEEAIKDVQEFGYTPRTSRGRYIKDVVLPEAGKSLRKMVGKTAGGLAGLDVLLREGDINKAAKILAETDKQVSDENFASDLAFALGQGSPLASTAIYTGGMALGGVSPKSLAKSAERRLGIKIPTREERAAQRESAGREKIAERLYDAAERVKRKPKEPLPIGEVEEIPFEKYLPEEELVPISTKGIEVGETTLEKFRGKEPAKKPATTKGLVVEELTPEQADVIATTAPISTKGIEVSDIHQSTFLEEALKGLEFGDVEIKTKKKKLTPEQIEAGMSGLIAKPETKTPTIKEPIKPQELAKGLEDFISVRRGGKVAAESPTKSPIKLEKPDTDRIIQEAYQAAKKKIGFNNVPVSDIIRFSGLPKEEVHNWLRKASSEGRAAPSRGDWSLSSKEEQAGALEIEDVGPSTALKKFPLIELYDQPKPIGGKVVPAVEPVKLVDTEKVFKAVQDIKKESGLRGTMLESVAQKLGVTKQEVVPVMRQLNAQGRVVSHHGNLEDTKGTFVFDVMKPTSGGTTLGSGLGGAEAMIPALTSGIKRGVKYLQAAVGKGPIKTSYKEAKFGGSIGYWGRLHQSPSDVARSRPVVQEFVDLGKQKVNESLRAVTEYNRKSSEISDLVDKNPADRKMLDALLQKGSANQEIYSDAQLANIPENIRKAYRKTREMYDEAHTQLNEVRKARGQEPVGYHKGYVSGALNTYRVFVGNRVIGSYKTKGGAEVAAKMLKKDGVEVSIKEDGGFDALHRRTGGSDPHRSISELNDEYFHRVGDYVAREKFLLSAENLYKEKFGDIHGQVPSGSVAHYLKNYIDNVSGRRYTLEAVINEFNKNTAGLSTISKYAGDKWFSDLMSGSAKALSLKLFGMFEVSSAMLNMHGLTYGYAKLGSKAMVDGMRRMARVSKQDATILDDIGLFKHDYLSGGDQPAMTKVGKTLRSTMILQIESDYRVRGALALGAYEKALAAGSSYKQAVQIARQSHNKLIGEFSVADMPVDLQKLGPSLARVLTQFSSIPRKQYEAWKHILTSDDITRNQKIRRFILPQLAIVGVSGAPYAKDFLSLVSSIYQGFTGEVFDAEKEMDAYFNELSKTSGFEMTGEIAQGVKDGLLNRLPVAADIPSRVGTGHVFANVSPGKAPAFAMLQQAWRQPTWSEAATQLFTPRSVKNLYENIQMGEDITDPYGRLILKEPTALEKGQKILGFRSGREVEAMQNRVLDIYQKARKGSISQKIGTEYSKARIRGDEEAMVSAIEKARERGIKPKNLRQAYKRKQKGY